MFHSIAVRVAVLSDLHLGARPRQAIFGHDPKLFEAWIAGIEATHDRVVLAGDIYQTDHVLWPSIASRLREYHAARAATPALSRRFAGDRYLYLHGNHDEIAGATGVPARVQLRHGGVTLLVTHGHQFDPVATRAPWAATAGTYATAVLRRTGLDRVARVLEGRDARSNTRGLVDETAPTRAGRSPSRNATARRSWFWGTRMRPRSS